MRKENEEKIILIAGLKIILATALEKSLNVNILKTLLLIFLEHSTAYKKNKSTAT